MALNQMNLRSNSVDFVKMKLMLLIIGGLLLTACKNNKIGDTIVEYSTDRSEISIDNFPHGRTGIEGFNTVTYPDDFSFQRVDEAIYEFITSKNFDKSHVGIKLRYTGKDQYGKDTVGKWVSIGSIDVNESKKYVDIHLWKRKFGIDELFSTIRKKQEVTNVSSLPSDIKNDILNQLSEPTLEEVSKKPEQDNLIDFTYGKGYITFHNAKKVPIKGMILAYYVNDGNWSGWMTAGKWDIAPGQKFKFPVPLNPSGTLGKEMYYHCMYEDVDGLMYEIGGDASFMISKNNEFVVLNADAPTPHDESNFYFDRFHKIEFGGSYKTFTVGIGEEPIDQ